MNGYMGKILNVDLSKGELTDEALDDKLCEDFIGGYGIGARLIYSRQKAGVDPLGPENTLGIMTGPFTGTGLPFTARYAVVVGRSPLTKGWGDANSGGDFGPYLKFAGYDGVFFTGAADKPVYLLIQDGKAELKDAAHLWGKDTIETENVLKAEHGKNTKVACIGPSGEKLSLISGIINDHGRAAGRSGVGAVMGSKKLKAVAVTGTAKIPMADPEGVQAFTKETIQGFADNPMVETWRSMGTAFMTADSALNGDSPVKNWGGDGPSDFPNAQNLSGENVIANLDKRYGCYRCPVACSGYMKAGTGDYNYPAGVKRPEYETLSTFGSMCLNDNLESIMVANDICNRYGLDTISAGCVIAFAIECYENGVITKDDTDGIELTWGNHRAIVAMTEKMGKREGLGDVLADGVKVAAEKIGKGADQYAVHIGGQELGMHDPKFIPSYLQGQPSSDGARYKMDPTPGRHTQHWGPGGFQHQLINATGLCMFSFLAGFTTDLISGPMKLVTGMDKPLDQWLAAGERISNLRQAINIREGQNPIKWAVHPRIVDAQSEGPLAGLSVDMEEQVNRNLDAMGWDRQARPSKEKLLELGLDDVAKDLWP